MDGCGALLELPAGERIDQGPRIGLGERSPHGGTVAECDRQTSALDLIGVGLTIFCGPDSGEVTPPTLAGSGGRLPVVSHVVDADTADALGIEYAGALVVRCAGRPAQLATTTRRSLHGIPIGTRRHAPQIPVEGRWECGPRSI
jgi:hypothetical protein